MASVQTPAGPTSCCLSADADRGSLCHQAMSRLPLICILESLGRWGQRPGDRGLVGNSLQGAGTRGLCLGPVSDPTGTVTRTCPISVAVDSAPRPALSPGSPPGLHPPFPERSEQLKQSTGDPLPQGRAPGGGRQRRGARGAPWHWCPDAGTGQVSESPACRLSSVHTTPQTPRKKQTQPFSLLGSSCLTNCFPRESAQACGRTQDN